MRHRLVAVEGSCEGSRRSQNRRFAIHGASCSFVLARTVGVSDRHASCLSGEGGARTRGTWVCTSSRETTMTLDVDSSERDTE